MMRTHAQPGPARSLAVGVFLSTLLSGCGGIALDSNDTGGVTTTADASSSGGTSRGPVGGEPLSTPGFTYHLGGSVTGLSATASALVIQDGLGHTLSIKGSGRFSFPNGFASGNDYVVSVNVQPAAPAQYCRVTNASGVFTVFDVTNVAINCLTTGRYLFAVNPNDNSGNGSLASFAIDPSTGALTAATGSPYTPTETGPDTVQLDPSGQYLYVANSTAGIISTESIGTGGVLTLDVSTISTGTATGPGPSPLISQPMSLAIDSSFLYVGLTSSAGSTLEAFTISGGVLTPAAGTLTASTYMAGNIPYSLAVDSSDALLFGAAPTDGDLFGDTIGSSGALTALSGSPIAFQQGAPSNTPYAVALAAGSKSLYVTDSTANTVSLYSYTASGAVTLVAVYDSGATVGLAPKGLTVDPTGSFLYVANSGSGTVSAFTINSLNGVLTPVAGSPFTASGTASPVTPTSVQVDPSAQFAYVSNGDAGTISTFAIDFTTGALVAVGQPVSSVVSAGGPSSIAVE